MNNNMTSTHFSINKNNKSIRLTFSYKQNEITLISKQKIDMVLPLTKSDYLNKEHYNKFWYELTNDKHEVTHKQEINNPIKSDIEIFSDEPKQSISRQKSTQIGVFSIVIPDNPDVSGFDLFSNFVPEAEMNNLQQATNIFHVDLKVDIN